MICVVIKGPSRQKIKEQILAHRESADLFEFYVDDYERDVDLSFLKEMKRLSDKPLLLTMRKKEGREKDLLELMEMAPDYVDFDVNDSEALYNQVCENYPQTKMILSTHHFDKLTVSLDRLFLKLQERKAFYYKMAVMPMTTGEALSFWVWAKEQKREDLIFVTMGEWGAFGRLLVPLFLSTWTYACVEEGLESASGQWPVSLLCERYNYKKGHKKTALYGLIGDPVTQSISDRTHNAFFKEVGKEALYVKMRVTKEDLSLVLQQASLLGFLGLSVTMPLKEEVLSYLEKECVEERAKKIGAVNTLTFEKGKIYGDNTDAQAALDALGVDVCQKKVAILGAGGAARAICYEAHQRGAKLFLFNRTLDTAHDVAFLYGGEAFLLSGFSQTDDLFFDVIINASSLPMPIDGSLLRRGQVVMDIVTYPRETPFLQEAKKRGCSIVYGEEMFLRQAQGQFKRWNIVSEKVSFKL